MVGPLGNRLREELGAGGLSRHQHLWRTESAIRAEGEESCKRSHRPGLWMALHRGLKRSKGAELSTATSASRWTLASPSKGGDLEQVASFHQVVGSRRTQVSAVSQSHLPAAVLKWGVRAAHPSVYYVDSTDSKGYFLRK